jgi:hypothetical protein
MNGKRRGQKITIEAEMAQMHEEMKRMGYGRMLDLDGIGDGPRPVADTKPGIP